MANRRQRRSERQSAGSEATTVRWLQQLPDGPCRLAVAHIIDEAISGGASEEVALAQGLVYATRLFPEEIVLWGLEGGTDRSLGRTLVSRGTSVLHRYISESCAHSSLIWPGKTLCSWMRWQSFALLSSRSSRPRPSSLSSRQRTSCPSPAPGTRLAPRT